MLINTEGLEKMAQERKEVEIQKQAEAEKLAELQRQDAEKYAHLFDPPEHEWHNRGWGVKEREPLDVDAAMRELGIYENGKELEQAPIEEANIYDRTLREEFKTEAEYKEFSAEYDAYLKQHDMTPAELDEMALYYEQKDKEKQLHQEQENAASQEFTSQPNTIRHLSPNQIQNDEADKSLSTLEVDVNDYGDRLKTHQNTELGGEELARIADEKGWKNIYVEGSEEFKRSAWREASSRNMDVEGYIPDGKDVEVTRDKAAQKGIDISDAAKMAEEKGVKSGYGAPEMKESEKAQALKTMSVSEVLSKYPELAKECAVIKASEAMINNNVKDPDVRAQALQNIRSDVAMRMDAGQRMPDVSISQAKQVERERAKEKDVEQTL